MAKSDFQKKIEQDLKPTLLFLGFKQVKMKHCISYEVLFNNRQLWFGASWDYRDQYLDISLGHLYWFGDVMPRVVILGKYESYCGKLDGLLRSKTWEMKAVIELVKNTLENSIEIYKERYEQILNEILKPTKRTYSKEFYSLLGQEVSDKDLSKYK